MHFCKEVTKIPGLLLPLALFAWHKASDCGIFGRFPVSLSSSLRAVRHLTESKRNVRADCTLYRAVFSLRPLTRRDVELLRTSKPA